MLSHAIGALLVGTTSLISCAGSDDDPAATVPVVATTGSAATAPTVMLTVDSTWQWQLQGELNTSYDVDVYDIDLFDTDAATIAELRAAGRVVICYFSAGSVEDFRPDAAEFDESVVGEALEGFADERWLDVRTDEVRSIMTDRLDLAVEKGCDGVEPDNVSADQEATGLDIDPADQLDYNRFLAAEAHRRGMLVALKNDLDQIPALVDDFDFAVNEECFEFGECNAYQPFLAAGKPVFNAEYSSEMAEAPESVCVQARDIGLRTLVLPADLDDAFRISCDD